MKKKILYIGDSITEGVTGINYINYIESKFPNHQHINQGLGGDTLKGISNRLLSLIKNERYDYIVFEAGHNDILIPYFSKQGLLLKLSANKLKHRGSIPTKIQNFSDVLENKIKKIRTLTKANIVITTLSCIGENMNSDLNKKRRDINRSIREVGEKYNCIIADVGNMFDDLLRDNGNSHYLIGGFFKLMVLDPLCSKKIKWADQLSKKRKLKLTIDGVHINDMGAKIYAEEIIKAFTRCPDFV